MHQSGDGSQAIFHNTTLSNNTARDISAGEEITVNYLDGADEEMTFEDRRRHLLRSHNFDIGGMIGGGA